MMRILFTLPTILLLVACSCWGALCSPPTTRADEMIECDVAVYGGTPAGIAAAVAAGDAGRTVVLIEPYRWIGGLNTNGLSHTDFRTFEGLTGTFLDFTKRIQDHYIAAYGKDAPQSDCFRGTHGEPHVNLQIWQQMLAEQPTVRVLTQRRLKAVVMTLVAGKPHIATITVSDKGRAPWTVAARVFIDATYEGDLLAAAGVPYRVGRESRDTYGESLAPETADTQVQGYNFRFAMTRDPDRRVLPSKPDGYDRELFVPLLPLFADGTLKSVFCSPSGGVYKYQPPELPNGKFDINDVSRGAVRLSLPDENDAWPDGDDAVREQILQRHLLHNVGMLYFLQNDDAVPANIRAEARQWGWCRDEFIDNGHVPEQLYVREARRMVGRHVFTQRDVEQAPGDARAVFHADSIAMGDYGPNCHGTAHEGPRFGGRHSGEFYLRVPPYQIPYATLLPRECDNLIVPVACSSSHVGFCALRLEPIWTSLGQAAGVAAYLAAVDNVPTDKVDVAKVQHMLHRQGAATIYTSDVLPGHADFAAVQWWSTLGGLHELAPPPATPGERGPHLFGQYYHAFPGHAVELDKPLDEQLRQRWLKLARAHNVASDQLPAATTRGEFIRDAFRHASP